MARPAARLGLDCSCKGSATAFARMMLVHSRFICAAMLLWGMSIQAKLSFCRRGQKMFSGGLA